MKEEHNLYSEILKLFKNNLGEEFNSYQFPPPVFTTMQGEFIALNLDRRSLTTRFPVDRDYLNPYGLLQGGIIAAAVDNTFGPLSVLLAPPSVTRHLEMKYSHPVSPDLKYIEVTAKLLKRDGRFLHFSADVRSPARLRLARAKAVHYIVDVQK